MIKDLIIIGSGPAGMTAALYALRANLTVTMIGDIPGGQMNNTLEIENYPGYKLITGPELSDLMFEPLNDYPNFEYVYGNVSSITFDKIHKLECDGETYEAKSIIIASGSTHKHLEVSGEEEFSGKGVSYCAVCDGSFFKNKHVVVVGGGDSALEEALYLSNIVDRVTIVHRRNEFRAQPIYQEKVKNTSNINIKWNTTVESIHGNNSVTHVKLNEEGNIYDFVTDGIFIYVGMIPNSEFVPEEITTNGWIKTNEKMETSINGIYAIGDIREKHLRQITTAVGDGAIAGQEVYNYITKINPNG